MVNSRGIGKPDYSKNVFRTAPPTKQDGQGRLYYHTTFNVVANTSSTVSPVTRPATGYKWVIYKTVITWNSNTLGYATITDVDGNFDFASRWGYGSVEIDIPDGYEYGAGNIIQMSFGNYDDEQRNVKWYFLGMIVRVDD